MLPMSNSTINPGAVETQHLRVTAPPGVSIILSEPTRHDIDNIHSQSQVRLRLRIGFMVAGQTIQEQVDFSGFPQGLTGAAR